MHLPIVTNRDDEQGFGTTGELASNDRSLGDVLSETRDLGRKRKVSLSFSFFFSRLVNGASKTGDEQV